MVVDALKHPRYKYFPETHEERFHSFLGVPLIEQKLPLGVVVVQTSRRREFSRDEIRLLTTISAQVSSILVQARLADSLRSKEEERKEYHKRMVEALRKLRSYEGRRRERAPARAPTLARTIKGSRRVSGFWPRSRLRSQTTDGNQRHPEEKAKNPEREMERFRAAVERGIEQMSVVKHRMSGLISKEEGAIFDVYRLILSCNHSTNRSSNSQGKICRRIRHPGGLRALPPINRANRRRLFARTNSQNVKTRHRDFWRTFQARLLSTLNFPKMPS